MAKEKYIGKWLYGEPIILAILIIILYLTLGFDQPLNTSFGFLATLLIYYIFFLVLQIHIEKKLEKKIYTTFLFYLFLKQQQNEHEITDDQLKIISKNFSSMLGQLPYLIDPKRTPYINLVNSTAIPIIKGAGDHEEGLIGAAKLVVSNPDLLGESKYRLITTALSNIISKSIILKIIVLLFLFDISNQSILLYATALSFSMAIFLRITKKL